MRRFFQTSLRFVFAVTGLACGADVLAAPPLIWNSSEVYREVYPVDGAELGRGWYQNEVTAAPGGCIKGVEIPFLSSDLAYSFSEVTNREQVFKALHVNANISQPGTDIAIPADRSAAVALLGGTAQSER